MNIEQQKNLLKEAIAEFKKAKIRVTGVFMPSAETDGGLELDNRYILQIAPYHNPVYILDACDVDGITEVGSSVDLKKLIELLGTIL